MLPTLDTPPEVDVAVLVAVILLDMEENVMILQATRTIHRNRRGQNLKLIVQIYQEDIEKIDRENTCRRYNSKSVSGMKNFEVL